MSIVEARKLYNLSDSVNLEDKLDESTITKLKNLPYISKKSITDIKREDIMGEDEVKIYSLIEDLDALTKKEALWSLYQEVKFEEAELQ